MLLLDIEVLQIKISLLSIDCCNMFAYKQIWEKNFNFRESFIKIDIDYFQFLLMAN